MAPIGDVVPISPTTRLLPGRPAPKGLLAGRPEPFPQPKADRFIVDNSGNAIIVPEGGSVEGNAEGTFVKTRYANGSMAYERHSGHPGTKRNAAEPHGHRYAPGTGRNNKQWGPSLDREGRPVRSDSEEAHLEIKP